MSYGFRVGNDKMKRKKKGFLWLSIAKSYWGYDGVWNEQSNGCEQKMVKKK